MEKYIERIEDSRLPYCIKKALVTYCNMIETIEQIKAEGKEPDRNWLEDKLKEHGI